MKQFKLFFLFLSMLSMPGIITAETKTLKVDTKNSNIAWVGKKIAGQHNGSLSLSDGKVIVSNQKLAGGEFTIDLNSLSCEDLTDEGYNKKLIGVIKSKDFFDIINFPTATVKINKVEKYTATEDKYKVIADVTIKGITNPVTFNAFFSAKDNKYSGNAAIVIDRTKWDIKYGSASFFDNIGDRAIKDEIELNVSLKTN